MMKMDYRLVQSVFTIVFMVLGCYVAFTGSQQIVGSDDAANVGRDLDLYFLDDEDSRDPRQPQQLVGGAHHVSKRDAPAASTSGGRRSSGSGVTSHANKRREQTIAESLMGSGDSEDSEEHESSEHRSKTSLPLQPSHASDDEDDEDIEGSGDIFALNTKPKVSSTTKRPGRFNGATPPPLREDTKPSTSAPAIEVSSTSTASSVSTTAAAATRRPSTLPSTTSMPEDDEDSEDEGDYDGGSGAGELIVGKATGHISTSNKDKTGTKKKPGHDDLLPSTGKKVPDESSSSKSVIEADEEYYDENDDDDDGEDLDDEDDTLSPPGGDLGGTSTPSMTSASPTTSSPTTSTTTSLPFTTPTMSTTTFVPSTTPSAAVSTSATSDKGKDFDDSDADDDDEDEGEDDDEDEGTDGGGEDSALDGDKRGSHKGTKPSGHIPEGNGVSELDTKKETGAGESSRGGGRKWDGSHETSQENDITHDTEDDNVISHGSSDELLLRHKATQRPPTLLGQPGILVAVMGGAVVGLLLAILCVMFVVYRMRKKDEGSYPLGKRNHDDHFSTHRRNYMRPSANKEFYA